MKLGKDLTAQIVMGIGTVVSVLTMVKFVQSHPIYGVFMLGGLVAVGVGYIMYTQNDEIN